MDLGFIIDGSGSVKQDGWEKTVDFLVNLTSTFNVKGGRVHVAALKFSDYDGTKMEFRFNDVNDTAGLIDTFEKMEYLGGSTLTDYALELANKEMFSYSRGMRPDAVKVSATFYWCPGRKRV